MLNLPLLRRQCQRLLVWRAPELTRMASRSWTVCPAETVRIPPTLTLPGATEKIKALSPWRDWRSEKLLLEGGWIEHAACTTHLLERVDVVEAFLYCGAARDQVGFGAERWFYEGLGPRIALDTAELATSRSGSHFFGTFLLDDMPLGLLSQGREDVIGMVKRPYEHEEGYRRLLGLPCPREVRHAHIGRLTIHVDFAQNSHKRRRYEELRSRLRRHLTSVVACRGAGVYVRRGLGGEPRVLLNEEEVVRILADAGFDVLDPATLTADEIASRSLEARIVVGVEGSHLSHAIYSMADDGAFLVLQPPDRFALAYKEYADRMEMRFAVLVGDRASQGFSVPASDLLKMLDRLI